jgi:hypothetical protein
MDLRTFGKLMKKRFGSVGGELLQKLHDFYVGDKESFEKIFDSIEEIGAKGCYLFDSDNEGESFIIFGIKYVDKKNKSISIKGTVMARGENCPWKVGDKLTPNPDIVNKFKMLDSAGLVNTISDLNMKTIEDNKEKE